MAAGALIWELGYFHGLGEPKNFTVEKGENFAALAHKLEEAGIVDNARALRWYVNLMAPSKKLKRGEFALATHMPVPELVEALTEGKPIEYRFTIPEGENIFQIAEMLEEKGFATKAEFVEAARSPRVLALIPGLRQGEQRPESIEGYIYPDTYLLQKVFSPEEIAAIMVLRFREVFKGIEPLLGGNPVVQEFRFSPHQLLTLASIVEKETGAARERPRIAGLFLNRLRKHMRLQTDPAVIYGIYLANGGEWDGHIGSKGLATPSPYNSYLNEGLPPGPIASPGANAIRAVLEPESSDFLYFVSRNDGTSVFCKDYACHAKAVQATQLAPGARSGKSWRDLPAEERAK